MAQSLPPAPVDNAPTPSIIPANGAASQAYISLNTWGALKLWFKQLQTILKGITNDGTTVEFPGSVKIDGNLELEGSLNGLPSFGDDKRADGVTVFGGNKYINVTASGPSFPQGTPNNLLQVSIPPGTWDVSGTVGFTPSGGGVPTAIISGVSTTSVALGPLGQSTLLQMVMGSGLIELSTPTVRFAFTVPTIVYLVGQFNTTGGAIAWQGVLRANPVGG